MSKKPTKKVLDLRECYFFFLFYFYLFLYPSTHNYNTLDIIKEDIVEIFLILTSETSNSDTTLEEII